jgi:hypothetical protein
MFKSISYCLLTILFSSNCLAQDVFFKAGKNFTTYDYKNSDGQKVFDFSAGEGFSYQIGLGLPIPLNRKNQHSQKEKAKDGRIRLRNEISLIANHYNAQGGDMNSNYTYETSFGGIQNQLSILAQIGKLEFGILGILGVNKLISGTQVINNERYNLKDYQEFRSEFLQTGLGGSVSYPLLKNAFLSATYQHTKNKRPKMQDEEHINFNSRIILLGIHFKIY